MNGAITTDEELIRRLPLPLAQLYRRAHNAKAALERHQAAYYLWEAALKLLASAGIVEFAEVKVRDSEICERLRNLARPALGHWWEFARRTVPLLAASGDEEFLHVRELLLGRTRDDLPRGAGLDSTLLEVLEGQPGPRNTVRLSELFERLVRYRNRELAHGAAGQRATDFYERLGHAILAGVSEVLARLDVLAGRRLIYIDDVRRQAAGTWLIERYELSGESARRIETIERPKSETSGLPYPGRLYLQTSKGELRLLHPLVVFDREAGEAFFLNARRGQSRTEYLSYSSGRVMEREELESEHREFLGRLLGTAMDSRATEGWALASQAEEPAGAVPEPEPARRRIGGFELISRIGQGGMGVVYRAWQPSLGRQVALKCLLRAGDPKAEARFAREIHSLGRVEHPHLVKIFTSGSDGDHWFYAMELLEGADLGSVFESLRGGSASEVSEAEWRRALSTACDDARRREKRLSDAEAPAEFASRTSPLDGSVIAVAEPERSSHSEGYQGVAIGEAHIANVVKLVHQVAGAAHCLHEAGVVHRDIKPGNIMVTPDGSHAVLMDLGLAQLADEAEGRLTRTRQFVGTLRYASPEQLLAAGTLDRRSDVYSLGATLWELLALKPLFGADDDTPAPDLMLKITSAEPRDLRKLNPRVPADLEAIALKCLEKDRARRYATAADLADDLGRFARGEAVSAQPPTLRYLFGKFARRHRAGLLAAVALLALAILGLAAAFYHIDRARAAAVVAQKQTETGLFDMYTSLGLRASEEGSPAQALLWFSNASSLARDDPERQRANQVRIKAWSREAPQPVRAFLLKGERPKEIAFDPSGAYLMALCEGDRCHVLDLVQETPLALAALDRPVRCGAWNPDGKSLALGRPSGEVEVLSFPAGERIASWSQGATIHALLFSPGGRYLAVSGDDVRIWDPTERRFAGARLPHPKVARRLAFNSRADRLATACDDGLARVFAVPPEGEAPRPIFPPVPHQTSSLAAGRRQNQLPALAFLDDDHKLVTVAKAKEACLWDSESGKLLFSIPHLLFGVGGIVSSYDGRYLLLIGDGYAALWDVSAGRQVGAISAPNPPAVAGVEDAVFSPDGAFFLTASDDRFVRLWSFQIGEKGLAPSSVADDLSPVGRVLHHYLTSSVAYSPDGRYFATGQGDGLIRVWTRSSGEGRDYHVPLSIASSYSVMSPDGKHWMPIGKRFDCPMVQTHVHEVLTGKQEGPALRCGGILTAGTFSPDGQAALILNSLASSIWERTADAYRPAKMPGQARFWDWKVGRELVPAISTPSEPIDAAYSPDGNLAVVLCAGGEVLCIDPVRGEMLRKLDHGASLESVPYSTRGSVGFAPDGQSFITWGLGRTVKAWDRTTYELRLSLEGEAENIYAAEFSTDGRLLVTSSGNLVTVWDLGTGKPACRALEHPNRVGQVKFSADGRRLLTGCSDNLARLWDWREGTLICPPFEHKADLSSAVFSVDGRWVLSSAWDGSFRIWETKTGKLVMPSRSVFQWAFQVLLPPDGSSALVPSPFGMRAFDLEVLEVDRNPSLDLGSLRVLGEIISGQRIHEQGAGIVNLTSDEWIERWKRFRRQHPSLHQVDFSLATRRAWHRRQAEVHEQVLQWDAAAWHLEQLERLGERVEPGSLARLRQFVRTWRFSPLTAPWADYDSLVGVDSERLRAIEASARSQPLVRSRGPFVDFVRQFPERIDLAGYVFRTIVVDQPRKVKILAGSDDSLRIWLNGGLIHASAVLRAAISDVDVVTASLVAGENRLVVEVSQAGGQWGLFLRLEDEYGHKLWLKDDGLLEELEVPK